ncbi:MAG: alkaline phosphatase family protein [Phycisphaerales bacterium]|nr:alkaline phosphatase family protein [Phycisphaerales bacterium]
MAHPTVVLNVVGLDAGLLRNHAPRLRSMAKEGTQRTIEPVFPALTCSAQSSMLTGLTPGDHGIIGNGWYDRESGEIRFWKQANQLVQGEKVWDVAKQRDPDFTCCNMFWWYNMYSSADIAVTPRPMYPADGRKIPDIWTHPPDLRDRLQRELGPFPLFHFWGPASDIRSSRWIADASRIVHESHAPDLQLIYLPHLDYALQQLGPDDPAIAGYVREIDDLAGDLVDHYRQHGCRVLVVSEYGIGPVEDAVEINRILRNAGLLAVREELGRELLDPGASRAFAVTDHQIAHVYLAPGTDHATVRTLLLEADGIDEVLDEAGQSARGARHERGGDLLCTSEPQRWFTWDYWNDDRRAPDFARTVDIHRKPGYDPRELFLDPKRTLPRLRIGWKLLKKKLGFRTLMDVIPLDTSLVRGSHGRTDLGADRTPVLLSTESLDDLPETVPATAIRDLMLRLLLD